jgi:hypothetical protein
MKPLRIAIWFLVSILSLATIQLVIGLAGFQGAWAAAFGRLLMLSFVAAPWVLGSLVLWHWGAAKLAELRGIRRALGEKEPRR